VRGRDEGIPNTEVQRRIREAAFIMELIDRKWPKTETQQQPQAKLSPEAGERVAACLPGRMPPSEFPPNARRLLRSVTIERRDVMDCRESDGRRSHCSVSTAIAHFERVRLIVKTMFGMRAAFLLGRMRNANFIPVIEGFLQRRRSPFELLPSNLNRQPAT